MKTTNNNTPAKYRELNKQIIEEITTTKDLTHNTKRTYNTAINQYTTYHQMSMQELILEADQEEEQRIRLKHRKIKKRILNFRQHLIQQGKQQSTINIHISKIISTYKFYEIETPQIPLLKIGKYETITDIPTKEHIKLVLENTNNLELKAIILFLSSSGTAKNEALSITLQDFINATKDYHKEISIHNVIDSLQQQDLVVPTFQLYRKKTRYPYISFCTPEATRSILTYLKYRISINKCVTPEDKLFLMSEGALTKQFGRLNDKLGMGWKTTRRFFHPHSLRKFFATELLKSDMDSITIDFLMGHKSNATQEAYFKADPKKLKQKYMQFMNNLMIQEQITYKDVTSNELKELEYYRQKDKQRDEKIRELESLLNNYLNKFD